MIIDGNVLALDMNLRLSGARSRMSRTPVFSIVVAESDNVPERLDPLVARAKDLSIELRVMSVSDVETRSFREKVEGLAQDDTVDAIAVCLPHDHDIDAHEVFRSIPLEKDATVISPEARALFAQENFPILPPAVGAMQHILERYGISVSGRETFVLGHDVVAGAPLAQFLRHLGARVTVFDNAVKNLGEFTREAELVVISPNFSHEWKTSDIMDGAIIVDARNVPLCRAVDDDAFSEIASKCAIFAAAEGGTAPMMISSLLKNVLILARNRHA